MGNFLTWDIVTLLSIAMVVGSVAIVIFLIFKVLQLMRRDAARHAGQAYTQGRPQADEGARVDDSAGSDGRA